MRPVTLNWDEWLDACTVASAPFDGRDPCGRLPLPRPLDSIHEYAAPGIGRLGFTGMILAGRVRDGITGPPRDSHPPQSVRGSVAGNDDQALDREAEVRKRVRGLCFVKRV